MNILFALIAACSQITSYRLCVVVNLFSGPAELGAFPNEETRTMRLSPTVQVTNKSDKAVQLPKILALDDMVRRQKKSEAAAAARTQAWPLYVGCHPAGIGEVGRNRRSKPE